MSKSKIVLLFLNLHSHSKLGQANKGDILKWLFTIEVKN